MNDVDSSVRNGRWRAVWHLLVAAAVVAAGVGVTATPAAASATAATAAVELTNLVAEDYHDPDRQLAVGGDVRISGEWSLPAGTAAGDAFTVTLPSEMRTVAGQKFRLTGAGDEVGTDYAVCTVYGQDITCTVTDAIGPAGAHGYVWFRGSVVSVYEGDAFVVTVDGAPIPVSMPGGITLPGGAVPTEASLECWYVTSTEFEYEVTFPGGTTSGTVGSLSVNGNTKWTDGRMQIVAYAPKSNYMGGANFREWTDAPLTATFDGAMLTWSLPAGGFNTDEYVLRIQTLASVDAQARSGDFTDCIGDVGGVAISDRSTYISTGFDEVDGITRVTLPTIRDTWCMGGGQLWPLENPYPVNGLTFAFVPDVAPGVTVRVTVGPQWGFELRIADPGWKWTSGGAAYKDFTFSDPDCGASAEARTLDAPQIANASCDSGEVQYDGSVYVNAEPGVTITGAGTYKPGETVRLVATSDTGSTLMAGNGWVVNDDGGLRYETRLPDTDCTFGLTWALPEVPTFTPWRVEDGVVVPPELIMPTTEGIVYTTESWSGAAQPDVLRATPLPGYALKNPSDVFWEFTNTFRAVVLGPAITWIDWPSMPPELREQWEQQQATDARADSPTVTSEPEAVPEATPAPDPSSEPTSEATPTPDASTEPTPEATPTPDSTTEPTSEATPMPDPTLEPTPELGVAPAAEAIESTPDPATTPKKKAKGRGSSAVTPVG